MTISKTSINKTKKETLDARPLSGKTILVTGAAKRLGRAIALAAAKHGADVAITYRESGQEARDVVAELAEWDVEALAVRCDITDEKSVREMVKEVGREFGGIDILVNNAANYETVEFEKITVAQWDAIFASNTRGPFLVFSGRRCRICESEKGASSIWDLSADCGRGRRMLTIVRRRPRFTC